jgi:hypothetical protein
MIYNLFNTVLTQIHTKLNFLITQQTWVTIPLILVYAPASAFEDDP